MDILNLLSNLEKVDQEIYERLSPRRKVMKDFFSIGKKVSLAALPMALGSMLQKAYGQSSSSTLVLDSLNFMLAMEYMEFHLYNNALVKTPALIPAADKAVITTIRDQEQAHINLWIQTIQTLKGKVPDAMPYEAFDYTKINPNINTTYATFLRTAMVIEDLGVRAYKGQLIPLMENNTVLAAAARVHSLEARHSAQIRQMVNKLQIANLKLLRPWPGQRRSDNGDLVKDNFNDSTLGNMAPVYDKDSTVANNEIRTVQAGISLVGINGNEGVTVAAAAESFDEYLLTVSAKKAANDLFIRAGFKLI
ncbi:ferritin-like domain-containing protein [Pedobacter gandavensis]|uniref:ferritin-like domain-containing protein n=1 Tax=Pedobacter gandavensis TaxID=2679963 RepID=UPI00292F22FB|nr:ferritin-like domain-containing protein [Pedobacter gandavensis]